MVLVKDFVLLVCDALEDVGLSAAPLEVRQGAGGGEREENRDEISPQCTAHMREHWLKFGWLEPVQCP
jgi:hypothetical protein